MIPVLSFFEKRRGATAFCPFLYNALVIHNLEQSKEYIIKFPCLLFIFQKIFH